jgi:hypothetical protein
MWTPVTLTDGTTAKAQGSGYGFGWRVRTVRGRKIVDHGGARPGYVADFGRWLDDRLTVILMPNLEGQRLIPLGERIAASYALKATANTPGKP